MKKTLTTVLLTAILLSCSNDNNSTEPIIQPKHLSFRIEAGSVDLSHTAYTINDNYDNPIPACYSTTVKTGDKITVLGGLDLGYLKGIITNIDGIKVQEVMMHKNTSFLPRSIQYSSCYSTGTTVLSNASIWKNDLSGELSITVE